MLGMCPPGMRTQIIIHPLARRACRCFDHFCCTLSHYKCCCLSAKALPIYKLHSSSPGRERDMGMHTRPGYRLGAHFKCAVSTVGATSGPKLERERRIRPTNTRIPHRRTLPSAST